MKETGGAGVERAGPGRGDASRGSARERLRREVRALPRWKKVLLAIAGVFVLAGGALAALGGGGEPDPGAAGAPGAVRSPGEPARGARGNSLRGDGNVLEDVFGPSVEPGAGAGEEEPSAADDSSVWTPFFLKAGFSFFVAFCAGFALRAFFKVSALALGAIFLVLFLLSYAGVVEVDWETLGTWFDRARGALGEEFASFRAFVGGSLPSAASATLGLIAGFKR